MKKRDLLKQLREIAAQKGVDFTGPVGRGRGPHDKYLVGATSVIIPRHTEIDEALAKSVIRKAEGA